MLKSHRFTAADIPKAERELIEEAMRAKGKTVSDPEVLKRYQLMYALRSSTAADIPKAERKFIELVLEQEGKTVSDVEVLKRYQLMHPEAR